MVFQTINKKLLELGPSLGFLLKKKRVEGIHKPRFTIAFIRGGSRIIENGGR